LYAARAVLAPIIIGVLIGYIFYPYARFIQYSTAIPHRPATAILYLILLAIIIPLIVVNVPTAIDQLQTIQDEVIAFLTDIEQAGPEATFEILGFRFFTQAFFDEVINALFNAIRSFAPSTLPLLLNVAQVALLTVITLLIGFYMTSDGDRFLASIEGAIPRPWQEDIEILVARIDNIWAAFFRSNLVIAIIVGLLVTAVSSLIGLPRPVLMGVLAGLLEFIPAVGQLIWAVIALTVAGLEGSTMGLLAGNNTVFMMVVLLVSIGYTQLVNRFLIPALAGETDRLHPATVIIGLIVGGALGGVLGIVLAAPTISTIKVIMAYVRDKIVDEPVSQPAELDSGEADPPTLEAT
jgi:predicted PurR-regulated permease PerM